MIRQDDWGTIDLKSKLNRRKVLCLSEACRINGAKGRRESRANTSNERYNLAGTPRGIRKTFRQTYSSSEGLRQDSIK